MRLYDFIVGPETAIPPLSPDAVLDLEILNYGQAKTEFTSRKSVGNSVAAVSDLKALVTQGGSVPFDRVEGQIVHVNSLDAFFRWVSASMLTSDSFCVLRPDDVASDASAGRWLIVNKSEPVFTNDTAASNYYGAKLKAGCKYFNTVTLKLTVYNGSAWGPVGSGGGGSSINWEMLGVSNPLESIVDSFKLLEFDSVSENEIYCTLAVPASYTSGAPIKLIGGLFAIASVTGKVLFQSVSTLLRPNSTVLGTYTNQRTSTNSEVTVNAVSNTITNIGDLDLTDSSGQINGVSVLAGDLLRVRLLRKNSSESSPAALNAKLFPNSFSPKFEV